MKLEWLNRLYAKYQAWGARRDITGLKKRGTITGQQLRYAALQPKTQDLFGRYTQAIRDNNESDLTKCRNEMRRLSVTEKAALALLLATLIDSN